MRELPRGTVTLLFTDIQGSTRMLQRLGRERYVAALEAHRKLFREVFGRHGGVEVETQGDSFLIAFPYARDAVSAAAECQLALASHDWDAEPIKVRMGVHTGEPTVSDGLYAGLDVHRAARVMSAAHGGQVLLSARTADLVATELPQGITMRRIGTFLLKDFDAGEPLTQLFVDGLPGSFPPIRAERAPTRYARLVPRPARRHPWLATGAIVLVASALAGAVLLNEPTQPKLQANALAELDAHTGRILGSVPVGDTPSAVAQAVGSIWVTNAGEATVSRVDPVQARVIRTIPMPGTPVGIVGGAGSLWVINTDLAAAHSSVTRIDPRYARVTAAIGLPSAALIGSGAGIAWDGSRIWAVTQAGSAFRVNPQTNRVDARVPVGEDPISVAAAGGSIWVANRRLASVSRIEPPSTVTATIAVGPQPSAIAAGAGALWVVDTGENAVRRIDPRTGSVVATIQVGQGPNAIAASATSVWVTNGDEQSVTRIDPRTNRVTRTVRLGYPPAAVEIAGNRVWVALQTPQATASTTPGRVLHLLTGDPGIIDSVDPPLAYTLITWLVEYSTCAKLFNHPDLPAPAGYRILPEIAETLPTLADGGRKYVITIRPGYRFSPPSNQTMTARTFKYSIERALAPGTKSYAVNFFSDIVGAHAYETGKASHISGVVAHGRTLTIELLRPNGDLPARLAMPFFCPVPIGTPRDFKGLAGIPSAGPYYIAAYTPGKQILLRANPNYHGSRPRRVRTIDIRQVATEEAAVRLVEANSADAVIDEHGGVPIPARYRPRYHRYRTPAVIYLALNTQRALFRSRRERQAVAVGLDRATAIAFSEDRVSVEGLLPTGFPGQSTRRAFSAHGNIAAARRLVGKQHRTAIYLTCSRAECIKQATLVGRQLEHIGIHVIVKGLDEDRLIATVSKPTGAFDITDTGWGMDYVDPADFLVPIATTHGLASNSNFAYFSDRAVTQAVDHASSLVGMKRYRAFSSIEWTLRTRDVPYVAIAQITRPILFSRRVGCQVYNPVYGIDLGSLCIRKH